MFALTIGLREASRSIGLSESELLAKCRNIGIPVYCCAPSSIAIWKFRSVTDDPRFSLLRRMAAQVAGSIDRELPGKRFTVKVLSPTLVDSELFFQLSNKNIEALLYTGRVKSRVFAHAHAVAEDGLLSRIEPGEPTAEEIGLLPSKSIPFIRSEPGMRFGGGYCDEFYGMAALKVQPQGLSDLREVTFLFKDVLLERKEFLENRQVLEPSQVEDILRVFPELRQSIGCDNNTNQLPGELIAMLSASIKAWSMTQPGETLKSQVAWIRTILAGKKEPSLSRDIIDKTFTLCAHGYDYSPSEPMHEWVPDPSRKPIVLVVQDNEELSAQIRRSGLLILVDSWLKHFKEQNLWDDENKKPNGKAIKAAADKAVDFLEAYTSRTVARNMRPVLAATRPWQDN